MSTTPYELAIIVPVLGRPHRVDPICDSIAAATPPCRIVFVADPDDEAEIGAIRRRQDAEERNQIDLLLSDAGYPGKINLGIAETTEPHIFAAADDLDFKTGWYEAAAELLGDGIGVVGTQDHGHRWIRAGKHAAHVLVSREWVKRHGVIDEPGKLYHEGYFHVCCDIELTESAQARGHWVFCWDSVVEHLHPFWGKGEMDATYQRAYDNERRKHDRALLRRRRELWAT